jgi:hypothetical protein
VFANAEAIQTMKAAVFQIRTSACCRTTSRTRTIKWVRQLQRRAPFAGEGRADQPIFQQAMADCAPWHGRRRQLHGQNA